MVLTHLQRRVWRALAALPQADTFALGGGAAMITLGLVERETTDLDLFGTKPEHLDRLGTVVDDALREQGFDVDRIRTTAALVRLQVRSADGSVTVDLGYIHPRFATVQTPDGQVASPQDLAADKLLAMWNRSEPRDYIDVHALAQRFSLDEMCRLAAQKDTGFRRDLLPYGLVPFDGLPRRRFDIDDDAYEQLKDWVHSTYDAVTEPTPERSPQGPSFGL